MGFACARAPRWYGGVKPHLPVMLMSDIYKNSISILKDLVKFDTTSRNSNLDIVEYIGRYLKAHGADLDFVMNAENTKANIIARLGPDVPGGILLSGHTDVVPVGDLKDWASDPFTLREAGDRFYGRGSTDMKGFLACVLAAVPEWSTLTLAKPIYMVFSYDEEVGCKGVPWAVQALKQRGIKPDLCIVGEPTNMQVAHAHKSRADINIEFNATGGHASKVNDADTTCANMLAVGFIAALNGAQAELRPLLGSDILGDASFAVTRWQTSDTHNVIAPHTHIHLDYRGRPGLGAETIEQALAPVAARAIESYLSARHGKATIELKAAVGNNGFACTDKDALALAAQLAGTTEAGVVKYVCEAAVFSQFGFAKTVICGPGSINQAHMTDEFIDGSELRACLGMMGRIGNYARTPIAPHQLAA